MVPEMPEALVAINVDVGKEDEVFNKLLEMPEVKEVFMVYGIYDIIALVEAPTMDQLRETITGKIRKIDGVKMTLTMVIVTRRVKNKG
ncbi:transcriptional regulator [Aeropyrum camini SY1 = JCM 12091]|uniref:Transcriptional regulator n=2 Tax=Aeropyrum camini TaxID=229980 RepID=U3TDA5_9CREN|nr:transcriptional regulator [Aeropyrum camini SY1 = JCM 12091]